MAYLVSVLNKLSLFHTKFPNWLPWHRPLSFRFKFQWSLIVPVYLKICQYWLRQHCSFDNCYAICMLHDMICVSMVVVDDQLRIGAKASSTTLMKWTMCGVCHDSILRGFVLLQHFFHHSIPYVVFSVMSVSCALFVLFLPETRDKPLPDALPHDRDFCCSHACRRRNHPYTITAGHEIKSDVTACWLNQYPCRSM